MEEVHVCLGGGSKVRGDSKAEGVEDKFVRDGVVIGGVGTLETVYYKPYTHSITTPPVISRRGICDRAFRLMDRTCNQRRIRYLISLSLSLFVNILISSQIMVTVASASYFDLNQEVSPRQDVKRNDSKAQFAKLFLLCPLCFL